MLKFSFFIFILIIYTYFLYPLLVFALSRLPLKAKADDKKVSYPSSTLLITGYNIEKLIDKKLENIYSLKYPGELSIVFVLDGCTDDSERLLMRGVESGFPFPMSVIASKTRHGKEAALYRAVKGLTTEALVFSDADAIMEAETITHLINRLQEPNMGAVCGREVHTKNSKYGASEGQGLFNKFEDFLKVNLSKISSLCYIQGGNFAMWRKYYPIENPVPMGATQDGIIAFDIVLQGKKVGYEPKATTMEPYSLSNLNDFKRRVRTISRAFYAILCRPQVLNPFKTKWFSLHLISGRILRWMSVPLTLVALCIGLILGPQWYKLLLILLSMTFAIFTLIGWYFEFRKNRKVFFYIFFYFTYIHLAATLAVFKVFLGYRTVVWKPSSQ